MGLQDELEQLLHHEGPTVEWKAGGDALQIVKKLTAFANGESAGWVLCGIEETTGPEGFVQPRIVGLEPTKLKQLKHRVPAWCRDKVHPPLVPYIEEVPVVGQPSRRLLGFWVSRSDHAHAVREARGKEHYPINSDSHTVEARGELLHELLARKGKLPAFADRPCLGASLEDVDFKALEAFVQEASLARSAADYLKPDVVFDSHPSRAPALRPRADPVFAWCLCRSDDLRGDFSNRRPQPTL